MVLAMTMLISTFIHCWNPQQNMNITKKILAIVIASWLIALKGAFQDVMLCLNLRFTDAKPVKKWCSTGE